MFKLRKLLDINSKSPGASVKVSVRPREIQLRIQESSAKDLVNFSNKTRSS